MIEPMQPDPAEAMRRLSTAEHLAARVAGVPSPSLLCTLHIGDSKLKSRATCDSTVLPRSPTDDPAPSGQRRCVIYPGNCYKRQAEAVRGGDLDQIAAITMATHAHMPPAAAFPTQACCCRRDACIPHG